VREGNDYWNFGKTFTTMYLLKFIFGWGPRRHGDIELFYYFLNVYMG
jgi:hypothetical protein